MYRRNGEFDKAIGAFDKAMPVDPKHETARVNQGLMLDEYVSIRQRNVAIQDEL